MTDHGQPNSADLAKYFEDSAKQGFPLHLSPRDKLFIADSLRIAAQRPEEKDGIPTAPYCEPSAPETAGTWEERCAALYQVIGALSSYAGIFSVSDDVAEALDVACGQGDVEKLLPWPKNAELFRDLEQRTARSARRNDTERLNWLLENLDPVELDAVLGRSAAEGTSIVTADEARKAIDSRREQGDGRG